MIKELPIEINNISKSFNQQIILQDVSLSVNNGEIFGLIGINGAGKTTLIKIILDLISADIGEAKFFGISSIEKNSRNKIAYLPEKFCPSQYLKGKEFLSLSLSYYNKNYDSELANKLAIKLDLNPLILSEKIDNYSKGMGQKLGLMASLLSEAPLLILDEPMSGLDPNARIRLKELLLEHAKAGKSLFFSSHILADIDEICHRIAVINNNQLIFIGTPEEFKIKYQHNNLEKAFLSAIEV